MFSSIVIWLSIAAAILADTSYFELELTWEKGAPDGHERDMILINGQYPGPLLRIQQGDWVEVEVKNYLPFSTSIHYHGIHQTNTPWADGVPGLTQRPIQPGGSFKYKWHAGQYGSYFYHAHSRGQIDDGAYGPIAIQPKASTLKPFDKIPAADVKELEEAEATARPLMVSDWRHRTSEMTQNDQLTSGIESAICMDSLLFNGKGEVQCLPRKEIDAYIDPGLAPILKANNLQLTDKGCLPPQFFQLTSRDRMAVNITTLPEEIFDICTPTQGSREVIDAPHDKNWLALDIISTASISTFAFSIDSHPMWVYAVDSHYIEPIKADILTVANGDRYSIFIQLDKKVGNYGIRLASLAATQVIKAAAVLSYGREDGTNLVSNSSIDLGGAPISNNITVLRQTMMKSFPPQFPQPAPAVAQTFFMHMGTIGNSYTWALNSTPLYHTKLDDRSLPILYQPPNLSNSGGNTTIFTKNNTWVDLIFLNIQTQAPPHPIHKHSNRAFVIGAGEGIFNWTTVEEAVAASPMNFNLITPPLRDGFVVPPTAAQPTWLAVRYQVVNPGPFMLHCHIQSHLNGGMAMIILDGVDAWPEVPEDYKN
ncbi:multicopper oxidase-domain-containing protein [Phaeosphaeriaceae sp. PMI808]|nr:multicopper oxidase-domain-containing protein [Phaeosphaeriaceae sp. PMI808]